MDTFVSSKELQKLIKTKDGDAVQEGADGICTNGYDNDGSTGLEIFENGFELGKRAESRGKQVYHFELGGGDTSVFFIGTEAEVKERIEALPDHDDVDDDEDNDEEDSGDDE
jgi:hypothetical protein